MLFYTTLGVLILLTFVVRSRVKRTYEGGQTLSGFTSLGFWVIDALHFVLILVSSLVREYAVIVIPLDVAGTIVGGVILVAMGLALMLAGMIEFRSIRRISGQDSSRLIKTGIYRWSRNPQYIGWFFILFGVSLVGRSGLALLLSSVGALLFHFYTVRMEEPYLERIYGEEYLLYMAMTPRYLGVPKPLKNGVTCLAEEKGDHITL